MAGMVPAAALLQMLDHIPRNEPAHCDALTAIHAKVQESRCHGQDRPRYLEDRD
jgi:hypothetical protein